jgi:tetratricopeptide (TPR) repeat protein
MRIDDAKKIIREAIAEIKELMRQDKWREAHRACLEILRFDPENVKIIRLKHKIENAVKKINRDAIVQDIRNLDPLWKEKKYEELLGYLKKLQPYAVDFPKISTLIIKATKAYKRQLLTLQEDFLKQEIKRISDMGAEGKYAEAVKSADKLLSQQFDDQRIRNLLAKLKNDWIESELQQNRGLTDSEKYEDILLFYQGLVHIDGKSEKIKRLIENVKRKYQVFRIQQRRELIYKQLEKIKTLFQMGRFEQVMALTEEILDVDPQNKEARFFLKKASKKAEKMLDKTILIQMKSARTQLKSEMKANRKNFTRI